MNPDIFSNVLTFLETTDKNAVSRIEKSVNTYFWQTLTKKESVHAFVHFTRLGNSKKIKELTNKYPYLHSVSTIACIFRFLGFQDKRRFRRTCKFANICFPLILTKGEAEDLFMHYVKLGQLEAIRSLVKIYPHLSYSKDNFPIYLASKYGHADIVQFLLADPEVDPACYDNSPIRKASHFGHTKVVELLLNATAVVDPAAGDNEAIMHAAKNGHAEVVKLLLSDNRVNPAINNNYPLQLASSNNRVEVVKLLLNDIRVNSASGFESAAHHAALSGHTEIVKLLLATGKVTRGGN